MSELAIGQRWLSETETDLGLGILQNLDYRLVTLFFPASDEERTYALNNAPIARMLFNIGDTIETAAGQSLEVTGFEDVQGVRIYHARAENSDDIIKVPESQLGHRLALHTASDRLFAGQLDSPRWFELRYAALNAKDRLVRTPIQGLSGARIDLIPHQLFIANEVASRFAPRVLLADEVGLGKTIEAGLILHQQLFTGRAERVLIIVPDALVHQWFVEMVRRFNLHFSIYTANRVTSLREELKGDEREHNPFAVEQLILMSSDELLAFEPEEIAAAGWDLLVVDEAHHLDWDAEQPGPTWEAVSLLSAAARGLLLLTATPEQLGQESHFARLQLLDAGRYPSYDAFLEEQSRYQQVAALAARIIDDENPSADLLQEAYTLLGETAPTAPNKAQTVAELLDRSGTGRVMFRNTRKHVQGFPERQGHGIALELPAELTPQEGDPLLAKLYPEAAFEDDSWCAFDPRVEWLSNFLKKNRQEKVLVICARQETAVDLQGHLAYKMGLNVATFHEDMDIIARDRAAAWFAEKDDGAQALICSEIGSEGRNFQFARHLVLFDLPLNPDLLEQRIGRLDRIGQQHAIQIHSLYFKQHALEILYRCYNEGMQAFSQPNAAGSAIFKAIKLDLLQQLRNGFDPAALETLVAQTENIAREARHKLEQGRDRLLEMSSFNAERAEALAEQLAELDEESTLPFMEQVFERYGVESEEHSEHAWVLQQGPEMVSAFPGLPEEGITVTDNRPTALSRDDMQFLSWEHPMVTGAIDMVLSDDHGKACVCVLKSKKIPPGTTFLELIYHLDANAPRALQAERFLPQSLLRLLLTASGKDMAGTIAHHQLSRQCHKLDKAVGRKVIASQKDELEKLLKMAQQQLAEKIEAIRSAAHQKVNQEMDTEIRRLEELRRKNPAIRQSEIDFLHQQKTSLGNALNNLQSQLAAVRLIVVNDN